MNQQVYDEKLSVLILEALPRIQLRASRLYGSGGINHDKYEDDYILPRICLSVALEEAAASLIPADWVKARREIANLRHF